MNALHLLPGCRIERIHRGDPTTFQLEAHGLRHSAATILLNEQGKNLREVQEALRHRDIRTTARYTHVAPEHTRGTIEALGGSLPALNGR